MQFYSPVVSVSVSTFMIYVHELAAETVHIPANSFTLFQSSTVGGSNVQGNTAIHQQASKHQAGLSADSRPLHDTPTLLYERGVGMRLQDCR